MMLMVDIDAHYQLCTAILSVKTATRELRSQTSKLTWLAVDSESATSAGKSEWQSELETETDIQG